MKPEKTVAFLLSNTERTRVSSDGRQLSCRCPFCLDSTKSDHGHFNIKIGPDDGEPLMYTCFRASCGESGFLTPKVLQEQFGCTDPEVLMELDQYNHLNIGTKVEKFFVAKKRRKFEMVNLNTKSNTVKLEYINHRLGTKLTTNDLRELKIQLSLYDFLAINNIHHLAYKPEYCDMLNAYTIGFLSAYGDYLICRDITKDLITKKRYTMYRAAGKPEPADMKLYVIPTELDILDPDPAEINVAEGAFSILGAYIHTNYGRKYHNSIWAANCGSEYKKTVMHFVKQYGLLDVIIHIWSDSEIGMGKYEQLVKDLNGHMKIKHFYVHYNNSAEDFGHASAMIDINTIQLI